MPGVVRCQTFLQTMCYACVVVLAGGDVTQNVDVVEMDSDLCNAPASFCLRRDWGCCPAPSADARFLEASLRYAHPGRRG